MDETLFYELTRYPAALHLGRGDGLSVSRLFAGTAPPSILDELAHAIDALRTEIREINVLLSLREAEGRK